MNIDPTWLLTAASLVCIYSVLSREAMAEFSLSDMEDMLRGRRRSKLLQAKVERFAERLDRFLFTFLLVNFLAKAIAAVAIFLLIQRFVGGPDSGPELLLYFIMGYAVWLLAIDMPLRPIAANHAETLTLWLLGSWRMVCVILWPITSLFALVHGGMERVVRSSNGADEEEQAEEDIMASLALGELQGQIAEHERDMIESILSMADLTVEEVMTPRTDMHAIAVSEGLDGAVILARETGHSRLPVYDGNRDNIIGLLYVKDLLGLQPAETTSLEELVRKATFVPATKKVSELLAELRKDRVHLAVVLDEYGGTAGLVTFEDLIEVVFGRIEDEYDQEEEEAIRPLSESSWDVDGRARVSELNERLKLTIPESEHYESLGGFITAELGCIPTVGTTLEKDDLTLTVTQSTDRRVVRVTIDYHEDEPRSERTERLERGDDGDDVNEEDGAPLT
ncbi:MAG: HlyC/CorC family transporter [Planctomycetota bacterium]|nr:MAG: HlyC/CorC family transporter [Planctomycetota bacterium]